jgi:hypothetical protein
MIGLVTLRRGLVGLVLLLAATLDQASAMTLDGVTMPDSMTVQGQVLQLNGMGLRSFTILHVHGYVAGLYAPRMAHSAQAILDMPGLKLLRVRYLHAAGAGRVRDEIQEGHRANCAAGCPEADEVAFRQLLETIHPVKPGDTNTYIYGPLDVQVLFNDRSLATIRSADFSRRMLDCLIGAHPPSKPLRDGLLGGSIEEQAFNAAGPAPGSARAH